MRLNALPTAIGLTAALLAPAAIVRAAPADPAAAPVEALDQALLGSMKAGAAAGVKGRLRRLEPVVDDTFDLPTMTRFAVGASWTGLSEPDKAALIKAFGRLTAASYAKNFASFGGERFEIQGVQPHGADRIVQTRLIQPHDAPVALLYRMRETGGGWKIIDVYFNGISQLTNRHSDFAAPLAAGGAKGLLEHLDTVTAKLLA